MGKRKTRGDKARIDQTVGKNIRKERDARKITREMLAEMIDISTAHLGLIEHGKRGASLVALEKITAIFNITIDSLFGEATPSLCEKLSANNAFCKRVSALTHQFSEPEQEFIVHTINGVKKMHKHECDTTDSA